MAGTPSLKPRRMWAVNWAGWWFAIFVVLCVARLQALSEFNTDAFSPRGLLSDALMAWCVALIFSFFGHVVVRVVALLIFSVLITGNAEYILENQGHASIDLWGYVSEGDILVSLFFTAHNIALTLFYTVLMYSLFSLYKHYASCITHAAWVMWVCGFIGAAALYAYPISEVDASWSQTSVLEENIKAISQSNNTQPMEEQDIRVPDTLKQYYARDMDAEKFVTWDRHSPPNILLFVIESASQVHVDNGWMPHLAKLQQQGLHYTQFVNQSRFTINGMYSLFCNDFPNLLLRRLHGKWLVKKHTRLHPTRPCIGKLLSDAGYNTVYMQAAKMGISGKETLLEKTHFRAIYGYNELFKGTAPFMFGSKRKRFGISDDELYPQVFEQVMELNQINEPWFLTSLNVGTHYPYQPPDDFMPEIKSKVERSFRYADEHIHQQVEQLKKQGVLDNTILIFTSDETRAVKGARYHPELKKNYGYMLVVLPQSVSAVIDAPYVQADFTISMADLLGLDTTAMMGRSMFRTYKKGRDFFLTRGSGRILYMIEGEKTVIKCTSSMSCQSAALTQRNVFLEKRLVFEDIELRQTQRDLILYNDQVDIAAPQ